MKLRKLTLILVVILIIGMMTACGAKEPKRYKAEFLNLFDTYTEIVGYTDDEETFKNQTQFIHDELEIYHQLYDIYNTYDGINNLKTINDQAGIAPVVVDEKILRLLDFCKEIYDMTDGQVNVAFGSVLSIWHDYREAATDSPDTAKLPPMKLLEEANKHANIDDVIIDHEKSTVYLADPDMSLDVGAVAKGFAVERVSEEAREQKGVTSMLLSVGGNVSAIGNKFDDEKWKVGIQNPDKGLEGEDDVLESVLLSDMSLVSSGDYQRYFTVDEKRYNHIIDPDTLMPADHFRAVTILCPDSGLADGLSTAAFLMDMKSSKKLIQSVPNTEAIYVLPDGSIQRIQ